jgi:hypothetical protein
MAGMVDGQWLMVNGRWLMVTAVIDHQPSTIDR